MIEIKNLSKRYPDAKEEVLKNINLTFSSTGLYYLIGKSGSGKTTFLSIIGAIDDEYSGSVKIDGQEIKELKEVEKAQLRFSKISFVFQDFSSLEEESVYDNLLLSLNLTKLSKDEKEKRIIAYLNKVGLKDKLKMKFQDLSGGEKKRIALVRALLCPTEILLVDEPVSSLNEKMRKEITQLLLEESKKRLVIIITHEKESIPEESTIYELINGNFHLIKEGEKGKDKSTIIPFLRRPYSLSSQMKSALSFFRSNIRFLSIVFIALTLALFSSSFSFQLSRNVSSSLSQSFSKYMKDNTAVLEKKEQGFIKENYESVSHQDLLYYQNRYPEYVVAADDFYLTSLNEIFQNNQKIAARKNRNEFLLSKFSIDSFLNHSTFAENELEPCTLKEDEVALIVEEEMFSGLYYLITGNKVSDFSQDAEDKLNANLSYQLVSIDILLNQSEWGYHLEHSFRLKKVYLGNSLQVLTNQIGFREHLVKDILHFKERYEEEKGNYPPWTLQKVSGLVLKKNRVVDFLITFIKDSYSDLFTLEILKQSTYFIKNKFETYNHIAIYKDYQSRISYSDLLSIYQKNKGKLSELSFSSPFYTYTASGYISGFFQPYFFSRYKDKLNAIQDKNIYSSYDYKSFQGSLIEVEEGVVKADLLSSMEGNGLVLKNQEDKTPLYGEKKNGCTSIGISSAFARKLFSRESDALNQKLYLLTLEKTKEEQGRFHNYYIENELLITSIYEDDDDSIYQDSLFSLCYPFYLTAGSREEFHLNNALMQVDFNSDGQNLFSSYPEYTVSFPMVELIKEMNKTLNLLSSIFFALALLSFLSSGFLMLLSFSLIIKKNQKEIGIMLSIGYYKKEILSYYFKLILTLSLFSYLSSFFFSFLTERMVKRTLEISLNSYRGDIFPFVISFLQMVVLILIIFFFLYQQIVKISPKEALRSASL